MITNLTTGPFLTTNSPGGMYYNSSNMPAAGMLRYHSGGKVEVFDGNNWMTVSSSANISLTAETEQILHWARGEMNKQAELIKLAKDHPAVKAAMEAVERAKEQLEIVKILSKEHNEQPAS